MSHSIFLSSLLFSTLSVAAPHTYYLIIHGTWSRPFGWHAPGGEFYDALSAVTDLGTVSFFLWSGDNTHEARVEASRRLVEFIQRHYAPEAQLNIVAHSHGSNVAILASQLLAKDPHNKHKIHNFYALGTPTNTESYMPDMRSIHYFYNMFSYNDFVQPVFGVFGREYPEHPRIANLFVTINGKEPRHGELHDALIAQWIPSIHRELAAQRLAGFEKFEFKKPGIIHFSSGKTPRYEFDTTREQKRERDKMIIDSINNLHASIRSKSRKRFTFSFWRKKHDIQK